MSRSEVERGAGRLSAASSALVLGVSCSWGILVTLIWVTVGVVLGGGLGAVNLVVVAVVVWGAVHGAVAAGASLLASFGLGRVLPRLARDAIAAILGWTVAFLIWSSLFGWSDRGIVIGSAIVAAIGAVLNFVVVQKRQGRV